MNHVRDCRKCGLEISGHNAKWGGTHRKTGVRSTVCRACAYAGQRERHALKTGRKSPVNKEREETDRLKATFAEFRRLEALNKPWLQHLRKAQ